MARHESYLVRVWWRAQPGKDEWVGRVEHLRQRKTCNFHDPEALLAYLREMIGAEPACARQEVTSMEDVPGKFEAYRVAENEETPLPIKLAWTT